MTFQEKIAAIQGTMSGCGPIGEAGKPFVLALPGLRERRRLFNSLAAQFDRILGRPCSACRWAIRPRDVAHRNGD